ncbi:MAG: hypothetical protein M3Y27_15635 [Acidobacteriota bacterium]|nr:hypothetical protein [Acidobacteriota bacterium]
MVRQINLEVHQHLKDDTYSDRIRIPEQFRGGIKEGRICKITVGSKSVLVEARGLLEEQRRIVRLDESTRNKLGVDCDQRYDFTLKTVSIIGQCKWAWNAADSAARIAARL